MGKNKSNHGCFVLIVTLGIISVVLKKLGTAIYIIFIGVGIFLAFVIAFKIIRLIYYAFNSTARIANNIRNIEALKAEKIKKELQETEKIKQEKIYEYEKRERITQQELIYKKNELERLMHRDCDHQESPYVYQIGKHGNESLAIRYGIANQKKNIKEYWYHAKRGEKKRNPDRDEVFYEPATTISLQKTKKLGKDLYDVLLVDYRNRKAKAIIEVGTEYVKTFYPYEENWFEKHSDLEITLKGNGTFNLKELATFHVQKTVGT